MESRSDFLIRSPEKIISKLSVLLKNKSLLTVGLGDRGNSFVSTVLEVNKKDNVFICDGCDEELIDQVLGCQKIFFKTEHLGAMVTFDATKATKTKHQGVLAFSVPIPSSMRWLEQREFYRVKTPVSTSSRCQIEVKGQDPISLKLYDISLRGFSVLNTSDDVSELLDPGAQFEKCKLVLEDKEEIAVSFEIRSKFVINPNNLNKTEKIGCKFTRITPAFENSIHGYMMEIEREILKKRSEQGDLVRH
jgi:c-di-GMP-binding flagellar brake protein YcgR